jgi:hypothetical protein
MARPIVDLYRKLEFGMLLQNSSVVGKAMGEALSSSSGQLRQVGSSGDPLIELPTFFFPPRPAWSLVSPFGASRVGYSVLGV